mmetsp:Transcript_13905/g.32387  ORF Transcript_13905/g.32387 Transcript_13905/m.32387 type:complete len:84 (-) Transcript_13905:1589-1840(-)
MFCLPVVRPLISTWSRHSQNVATTRIRIISTSTNRKKTKIRNQWLHTNYDRKRHADVNRSTGGIFFVISTAAAGISIFIMGKG